jgi:hypothetical protein
MLRAKVAAIAILRTPKTAPSLLLLSLLLPVLILPWLNLLFLSATLIPFRLLPCLLLLAALIPPILNLSAPPILILRLMGTLLIMAGLLSCFLLLPVPILLLVFVVLLSIGRKSDSKNQREYSRTKDCKFHGLTSYLQ